MSRLSPVLDHIIILISHDTLLNLSDHIQHLFTLIPGGTHADGLTWNKLVLLSDGVYIEFIAFFPHADPEKRRNHRWGNQKEGTIIDWAFTLPSDSSEDFGHVLQRVKDVDTGFLYGDLVHGGRTKECGTVIKWALSFPIDSSGNTAIPGYLPFWCFDRTPRDLRVPYATEPRLTDHPCGVRGISSLSVSVPPNEALDTRKVYNAIFGHSDSTTTAWRYGVPSCSTAERHTVSLSGLEGEVAIRLALSGPNRGKLEVLPGIVFEVE